MAFTATHDQQDSGIHYTHTKKVKSRLGCLKDAGDLLPLAYEGAHRHLKLHLAIANLQTMPPRLADTTMHRLHNSAA